MLMSNSGNKYKFNAIVGRGSNNEAVVLSKVLKNGKLGKPMSYLLFGSERTAEDVIARLEKNNPGCKWIETK